MLRKLILKPGQKKYIHASNKKYLISCDTFKDHDHKNQPLYYYHHKEKPTDIVITVEGNDPPPYYSPYSGLVEKDWIVQRENVVLRFRKIGEDGVEVEIEEV